MKGSPVRVRASASLDAQHRFRCRADAGRDGPSIVDLSNNTVQGVALRGIDLALRDVSGGSLDANVTNNVVTVTSSSGSDAVRMAAGALSGDSGVLCANVVGNTASSVLADGISVDQSANTVFRLPGYGGPPDAVDLVRAFLAGLNPATPDTISATADFPLFGGGFVGGAPCALPNGP